MKVGGRTEDLNYLWIMFKAYFCAELPYNWIHFTSSKTDPIFSFLYKSKNTDINFSTTKDYRHKKFKKNFKHKSRICFVWRKYIFFSFTVQSVLHKMYQKNRNRETFRQGWACVLFKRTQSSCVLLGSFQKKAMFLCPFVFFIKRTLHSL